jgi:hypothetical protein
MVQKFEVRRLDCFPQGNLFMLMQPYTRDLTVYAYTFAHVIHICHVFSKYRKYSKMEKKIENFTIASTFSI